MKDNYLHSVIGVNFRRDRPLLHFNYHMWYCNPALHAIGRTLITLII